MGNSSAERELTDHEVELDIPRLGHRVMRLTSRSQVPNGAPARYFLLGILDITERKRAQEELLRLNRAHRALSSCDEALIRATDESAWLEQVCRLIVDTAGYRFCWVGYAEQDDAKAVRPLAQAGFDEGYLKTANITWANTEHGRGPTGTCIRRSETQVVTNITADPRLAPRRSEALKRGYASGIAIPVVVDSNVFGALSIYSSRTEAFGDAKSGNVFCWLIEQQHLLDPDAALSSSRSTSQMHQPQISLYPSQSIHPLAR